MFIRQSRYTFITRDTLLRYTPPQCEKYTPPATTVFKLLYYWLHVSAFMKRHHQAI